MDECVRLTAHFSGQVQGVGFRYTAIRIARLYPMVTGYVQNLPDGRVRLVAEAPAAHLEAFLGALAEDMKDQIRSVAKTLDAATGEFAGFGVRH